MSTISIDRQPSQFQLRAASALADVLAWGLSLFRPITQYTEEVYEDDGHGGDTCKLVSDPNVFVFPLLNASPFAVHAWLERDAREGCLNVWVLGCRIEVWYESKRAGSSTR